MSILVTGAAGQIGGNIVRILHERGLNPIAFDILPLAPHSVLWDVRDKIKYVTGSIVDLDQLLWIIKDHEVEGIIHTAVLMTELANRRPVDAIRVMMEGTVNVLEAVRLMGLRRAVCCSTAAASGAHTDLARAVTEDDPPVLPLSGIYPVLKMANEGLCHNYQTLFGISAISVRPSRCYGPGTPPERRDVLPIEYLIGEAVDGRSVELPAGADTPVDYTYIKDEADGIIKVYQAQSPKYGLYNISFGALRTPLQVAEVLRKVFPGQRFSVGPGIWEGSSTSARQWIPKAEFSGPRYKTAIRPPLDNTRARTDLGYSPHDLDLGIPDYVRWLKHRDYVLPERVGMQ